MNAKQLAKKIRAEIAKRASEKNNKPVVVVLHRDEVIENYNPHAYYVRTNYSSHPE